MKAHVQNPWTKRPSLMVSLSVEEVLQLEAALDAIKRHYIQVGSDRPKLDANEQDALNQLRVQLETCLSTALPRGLKGVVP